MAKQLRLTVTAAVTALLANGASAQAVDTAGAPAGACHNLQPQAEVIPGAQPVTYRTASGRDLRLHLFTPAGSGPHPAVLLFFGGGWSSGQVTHFQDQARAMRDLGYLAAIPDYRVFCRDRTTPDVAVDDARAAYAWLREHARDLGIDNNRIVVGGGSAGGHLAAIIGAMAPSEAKPAALLLFNPVLDLAQRPIAGSVRLGKAEALAISPAHLPKKGLPPMMIFHGTADQVAPFDSVRSFCAAVNDAGGSCDLQPYEGAPHGFFNRRQPGAVDGQSYYADTLSKAEQFLAKLKITPPAAQ